MAKAATKKTATKARGPRTVKQAVKHARKPKVDASRAVPAPKRTARGFEAGRSGRRLTAIPTTAAAINSQIRQYGRNVLARSRYLATNNAYAMAAKEAYVSALVGGGIKPSSLSKNAEVKKALQSAWLLWTDESDADGITDFYGQQTIIASEMFEAGECFVRMRPRLASDGLSVPLQLQILPSEMLPTDHNEVLANGGRIECGVEFSPIGQRVAYWFLRNHPLETSSGLLYTGGAGGRTGKTRVPASEVLHMFKPIRAGQIRGIPHTLAGIVTLSMIDLYDDAELERKRVAALFGAFIKRKVVNPDEEHPFGDEPDAGALVNDFSEKLDPNELSDFSLEPGAVIDLADGQDVAFAEPADVGANYEAFQYRNLLRAACGFGVPYSDMTGDLRQTSYSSIRAGVIAFRRRIEAQQHQVMVFQFCRPVWKAWLAAAVGVRAIYDDNGKVLITATAFLATPRLFVAVKWIPPKWEWVDPLKDRQAEKLAVDSGFKPRSDVIEAEGYDPEEVDQRIADDQARAGALGIKFITLSAEVVIAPDDTEEDDLASVSQPPLNSYADDDFG